MAGDKSSPAGKVGKVGRPGQAPEGAGVGRVAVLKRVVPEGHRRVIPEDRVWEETRTYPREVEATRGF